MLIHAHDQAPDDGAWRRFATDQGFGHLVASGRGRDTAVVVPTQYVVRPDDVILHLARPNPVWAAIEENSKVVLSVAGDWAYIPAAWKAIGVEDPTMGVPTTYYAAVQIEGTAEVVDEPDQIAEILRLQIGEFEPNSDIADPAQHTGKLRAIRGLRITIDEVRAKFKYGGNVDSDHRAAIAARLAERSNPGDASARSHIADR
ncbi:MAG: FMN-binding negative transcriptional regulator [Acidimicrobiales bacterium]